VKVPPQRTAVLCTVYWICILDLCTVYCVLCTGSSCRSWSTRLQTSSTRRSAPIRIRKLAAVRRYSTYGAAAASQPPPPQRRRRRPSRTCPPLTAVDVAGPLIVVCGGRQYRRLQFGRARPIVTPTPRRLATAAATLLLLLLLLLLHVPWRVLCRDVCRDCCDV
jgi:hypothetical protein